MSRSGYSDDLDSCDLARWRGAVTSAVRGALGQTLLHDLRNALDQMPEKRLITGDLIRADGDCCVLGALAAQRNMDVEGVDPDDRDAVATLFDIAPALAAEIVYMNDECGDWPSPETPEQRWARMREWVDELCIGAKS